MAATVSVRVNLPGAPMATLVIRPLLQSLGIFSAAEIAAKLVTFRKVFNDTLAADMRRLMVAPVVRALPVRTGRLRQSVRFLRQGDNVFFVAVFYGRWNRFYPAVVAAFAKRVPPLIERALQAGLDAI